VKASMTSLTSLETAAVATTALCVVQQVRIAS